MIAIVDYRSGNIAAIANIYKQLKVPHVVTRDPAQLAAAERYILPGVGAFDATMRHLNEAGIKAVLDEQVLTRRKKIMGICVGMQILADSSEEGTLRGLGWIPGRVKKIDTRRIDSGPRLPHMGWNSVRPSGALPIFQGVDCQRGFYFLHSYFFDAARDEDVAATVTYGSEMPCALLHGNVAAMQFHPEKSHANGVAIFRNFANW
jgi:imidazole glycerol-phosphate synthase subunit HisH